jgi:HEAT repeat protein
MKNYSTALFAFLAATSFLAAHPALAARAPERKTLCTATINSSDEKEAFQEYLEPLGYDLVELTEQKLNDQKNSGDLNTDWFEASCKKKIQCDVLVVSGHFGGAFFGQTGLSLSIEKLEENSCRQDCSGILKRPKEVFLFGCNTMAGKEKDRRTPEQYLQVLLDDGFTRSQAEATVGFRYSPIGNTFNDRMRRVFSNTPRIYGFSSIGPAGKSVSAMLHNYLSSSKEYYSKLEVNSDLNQNFLSKLKVTAVTQAAGDRESSTPICYLGSPQVGQLEKLKWIKGELDSGNFLKSVHSIKYALTKINSNQWVPTREEKEIITAIADNKSVKEIVLGFLKKPYAYMLTVQLDLVSIAQDLNWISDEEADQALIRLVWGSPQEEFTVEQRNLICSFDNPIPAPRHVPANRYKNYYFVSALSCARSVDEETLLKIIGTLKTEDSVSKLNIIRLIEVMKFSSEAADLAVIDLLKTADETLAVEIASYYVKDRGLSSEPIQAALANLLKNQNPNARAYAAQALGTTHTKNEKVYFALADLLKDGNEVVQSEAAGALGELKVKNPEIHQALAKLIKNHDTQVRTRAMGALGKGKTQDEKIQLALLEIVKKDPSDFVRSSAIMALGDTRSGNEEIQLAMIPLLTNPDLTRIPVEALGKMKPVSAKVMSQLLAMLKNPDYRVRSPAIEVLGRMKIQDEKTQFEIAAFLKDPELEIRFTAADALGRMKTKHERIQLALVQLLQDESSVAQLQASEALIRIMPTSAKVREALIKTANDPKASEYTVLYANDVLKKLGLAN